LGEKVSTSTEELRQKYVMITLGIYMVFGICLILLTLRAIVLVPALSRTLSNVNTALVSIQAIETNTTRTEAELAGLLNTTRHIALEEQKAQNQQLEAIQKLNDRAILLLDDTDKGVQQFTSSMQSLGLIAPAVNQSVTRIADSSTALLDTSKGMVQAATDDLSDPNLHQAVNDLAASSGQLKVATTEGAATMTSVHKAVDYEIAELMKPVKKVKVAILFMATVAGKFFGY
jgi:hypothetical protein